MSPDYWDRVRDKAAELGTDGCSYASAAYKDCCLEHDVFYKLGTKLDGTPITQAEADLRLRSCIQSRSRVFGWYSPVAWGRYFLLKLRGHIAWNENARIRAEDARRRAALAEEDGAA